MTHRLRGGNLQCVVQRQGTQAEPSTPQELKRHRADYRQTQVARMCRANYRQERIPERGSSEDLQRVSSPRHLHKRNENTCPHKDLYTNVQSNFFPIALNWKQSKCPLKDKWINRQWYIHSVEYHSAATWNELSIQKNGSMYLVEWWPPKRCAHVLDP